MKIEVSNGEVIDKITILQLKRKNIQDSEKLLNIERELEILLTSANALLISPAVQSQYLALLEVNSTLWQVEDSLREKERAKQFDEDFIQLARDVYYTNDKRAAIKKEINLITNSELVEEKSYEQY